MTKRNSSSTFLGEEVERKIVLAELQTINLNAIIDYGKEAPPLPSAQPAKGPGNTTG